MRKILATLAIVVGSVALVGSTEIALHDSPVAHRLATSLKEVGDNLAAVFFHESITVADLENKYKSAASGQNKIRVLIVPGHEPDYGGAEYLSLKERDMTVDLGNYLFGFLNSDKHYSAFLTRNKQNWDTTFSDYFSTHWGEILTFFNAQKNAMQRLVDIGLIKSTTGVIHNNAPSDVAARLYGVNKWANDNDIDIEIHVHFNDYPRYNGSSPGKYSGFAIYVPEAQYSNSTTTKAVAEAVFKRLAKYNATSNLPKEGAGVVEDQDLIAVGSNNSADAASMLIEYGYIYETQFQDPVVLNAALKDLAYQTYLGLQDFFGQDTSTFASFDTAVLPYSWSKTLQPTAEKTDRSDVFALQTALIADGDYPVSGQTKNDCPRSGVFGPCTLDSLKTFQSKYNIRGEAGFVGPITHAKLSSLYGY